MDILELTKAQALNSVSSESALQSLVCVAVTVALETAIYKHGFFLDETHAEMSFSCVTVTVWSVQWAPSVLASSPDNPALPESCDMLQRQSMV